MMKKYWVKGAMLLTSATLMGIGFGGCLSAAVQRILVAVNFD